MYLPINLINISMESGWEDNNNNPELLARQTFRIKAAALRRAFALRLEGRKIEMARPNVRIC